MPSIDSAGLVKEIIKNNGHYSDDPQVYQIAQYKNQWGGITYHLAYSNNDINALWDSPYCHDIKILWTRWDGLQEEGKEFIKVS